MRRKISYLKKALTLISKRKIFLYIGFGIFFSTMTFLFIGRNGETLYDFNTIHEVKNLYEFLDENPKMDNDNIVKPDYATCLSRWRGGYLTYVKEFMGYSERIPWSEKAFIELIKRVTAKRKEVGYGANTIVKKQLQEGDRVIVFGNLQGAFHSLVRDLEELIRMGIMNNNLRLEKASDYIFCLGDAINRSPYSLETLNVLLRLMEENPDQVFYLQGNHEENNYWKDFTMKEELIAKIQSRRGEAIPLEKEINDFFLTLPLAWYGEVYPMGSKKFLRVSHEGTDFEKLKEQAFKDFLNKGYSSLVEKYQIQAQSLQMGGADETPLIGIIRAEKKRKTYQTMDGMRLLPPEEGVVAWTVLSCPTKVYQLGIQFFYDAFAIVSCKGNVADWTITLYNQDIRLKNGFQARVHNFLSGAIITGNDIERKESMQKSTVSQVAQPVVQGTVKTQGSSPVVQQGVTTIAPSPQKVEPVVAKVQPLVVDPSRVEVREEKNADDIEMQKKEGVKEEDADENIDDVLIQKKIRKEETIESKPVHVEQEHIVRQEPTPLMESQDISEALPINPTENKVPADLS